ncbi:MAG: DEAD/DEAH box helicase [Candidatus Latescibacterota bacterium]|nr:DEAD/DEAH box helicase [Candidatus Latescibacterota bacterium]
MGGSVDGDVGGPANAGGQLPSARARAEEIARSLYPHQVEGLAFLLGRRRSILADDMGLGKTRQSVLAMVEAEPTGPYLVICPATVKGNWVREILIVLPDAETTIVGPARTPAADFSGWVIINYDLLKREVDALLQHRWSGLVFDEAHYLKNHRTIRNRLSMRLVAETGSPVVHALTGTPLTNRPRDLFPLLQLVDHALGKSFLSFAKRYCHAHKNDYGYWVTTGASNIEELSVQLHGIMLRRTKANVLDLPLKMRSWIDVVVPQHVVERLNDAVRSLLAPDGARDPKGRRRGIGMLQSARSRLARAKASHTLAFVQDAVDQGEKVLLYSGFLRPIERFARHFGDAAVVVTGDVPAAKRLDLVDRFQGDPTVSVFIGQILAGGTGVNLTAASQVVFNDLDWVPANHWQAEDRAYRIGQTGTVNVTYMVARGTLEEFVRTVLEAKARLVDDVVEGKSLVADMNTDVMTELRRMLEVIGDRFQAIDRPKATEEEILAVLRAAGEAYIAEQAAALDGDRKEELLPVSEQAILALTRVLSGPDRTVFRVASSRDPAVSYTLEVSGADIICTCKGFEYRGNCVHARKLKEASVSGADLPEGFEKIV